MKSISATTRKRLEMQGFVGMSDADLFEIRPWLRVSPAITITWMATVLFLESATLGVIFIGAALLPVTTDFCIPAYLYGLIFGKPVACRAVKSNLIKLD